MMNDFLKGALGDLHRTTVTDHSNIGTDIAFTVLDSLPTRTTKKKLLETDENKQVKRVAKTPKEQAQLEKDEQTLTIFSCWVGGFCVFFALLGAIIA